MTTLRITNVTLILPDRLIEQGEVMCVGDRITSVGKAKRRAVSKATTIDGERAYLAPGLIDLHVHGGGGADFMDGTPAAVEQVCRIHARHGTTTIFPTSTTGSPEQLTAFFEAVKQVKDSRLKGTGCRIGGVHLYGPYFAPDKVGCHAASGRREPLADEYRRYFETGLIRIATCAAELPGAADFYREARRRRCLITCGHSNASWPEMEAAFQLGMRHVDHFWCAMSNVASVRSRMGVPMRGSMLEYVLGNPEMSTEVIADGCHLASELLDFAYRMKGATRLCLVTDSSRALDMPAGRYRFGSINDGTWFESDGKVGWASPGVLASSVVGMDQMVRRMLSDSSASLPEVIRMASLTPAERVGIAKRTGSLEVGKQADFVLLDADLQVQRVLVGGKELRDLDH